jgi:hypothetical protein
MTNHTEAAAHYASIGGPLSDRGRALLDTMSAQPVERQELSEAALLWVLWHHQGGSSPVGQPIREALGIGQLDHLTDEQVALAKSYDAHKSAELRSADRGQA